MEKIYKKNINLFNDNFLSTNDVLLKPRTGIVNSRKEVDANSTFIYSSPMDTVVSESLIFEMLKTNQAAVSCRFDLMSSRLKQLAKFYKNKNYWFSVGASTRDYNALSEWVKDNPDARINISVDVAHGDTEALHDIYNIYSAAPWCNKIMSGTVATPQSAKNVYNAGCTHIRVGIGPGSACSTRIVTGCGVPNLTAVFSIWLLFQDPIYKQPPIIIADGGIKSSGDIAKYLSAGASGVMIGNLLSKTEESAGWKVSKFYKLLNILTLFYFFKDKIYYKRYRGQASKSFQLAKKGFVSGTPEGVEGPIQYPQYSYISFYNSTVSALKSTVSYLGGKDISFLSPSNVEFIKITQNALLESKPHLLI